MRRRMPGCASRSIRFALKGFNEDELFRLAEWCASRDMDLTFIEGHAYGRPRAAKTALASTGA